MKRISLTQAAKLTGEQYQNLRKAVLSEMKSNPDFKPEITTKRKNHYYLLTMDEIKTLCPNWAGVK